MFIDNTKKIICLSIAHVTPLSTEIFFREQLQNNVRWMLSRNWSISSLILENYLTHPISEYDIYSLCRNPIDRVVDTYLDLITLPGKLDNLRKVADLSSEFYDTSKLIENVKTSIDQEFGLDKIIQSNSSKDLVTQMKFAKQIIWLKHENTTINHIFKYEDIDNMVNELCSRYGVDHSLYIKHEESPVFEQAKNILGAEQILEIETYYAEDKALYDSL